VSFGLALGVGHESVAEYLDVELADAVELEGFPERISAAMPDGIDVAGACELTTRALSLQEAVTEVEIELRLAGVDAAALTDAAERAVLADTLPTTTTRKGRSVVEDLRPVLRDLIVHCDDRTPVVLASLNTQPRGLRPADLLVALRELAGTALGDGEDRVLRKHQWIERDGARLEPLEADRATRTATRLRVTSKGLTNDRRDDPGGDGLRTDHAGAAGTGTRRIA
jgi:radical SAM-linked protein